MLSRFFAGLLSTAALLGIALGIAFLLSSAPASEAGSIRRLRANPACRGIRRDSGEFARCSILGYNPSTEVTDFVVPYGTLADANSAGVFALGTAPGIISMRPALRFGAQITIRNFDLRRTP